LFSCFLAIASAFHHTPPDIFGVLADLRLDVGHIWGEHMSDSEDDDDGERKTQRGGGSGGGGAETTASKHRFCIREVAWSKDPFGQRLAVTVNVRGSHLKKGSGGGGVKRNAMLGACLARVGSAIYEQQAASNDECPCDYLSGQICVMAVRLGAPATLRTAWVFLEMRHNTDYTFREDERTEKERQSDLKQCQQWLAMAKESCQLSKRYVAKEDTALLMRVECMMVEINLQSPGVTVEDMLGQVQAWPWSLEELSVFALFSVCCLLLDNGGICYMEKYLERGERIVAENPAPENPELFHELRAEYDYSIGLEREDK